MLISEFVVKYNFSCKKSCSRVQMDQKYLVLKLKQLNSWRMIEKTAKCRLDLQKMTRCIWDCQVQKFPNYFLIGSSTLILCLISLCFLVLFFQINCHSNNKNVYYNNETRWSEVQTTFPLNWIKYAVFTPVLKFFEFFLSERSYYRRSTESYEKFVLHFTHHVFTVLKTRLRHPWKRFGQRLSFLFYTFEIEIIKHRRHYHFRPSDWTSFHAQLHHHDKRWRINISTAIRCVQIEKSCVKHKRAS